MFVDFICNHYRYKLSDSRKKQIRVQGPLILSFPTGNTKAAFQLVHGLLNVYTYFVGVFPLLCAAYSVGIGSKILFGINVDHSSTGRRGAWIAAMAYTTFGFSYFIVFPFHFRAYELHGRNPAAQMGIAPFSPH